MTDRVAPLSRQRVTHADGWAAHVPLALVMLALLALVALPVMADRYVAPLSREVREVVEPGRGLVTDIHVSLALEASAFHDYQDTRQPEYLRRYEQAYAREIAAYATLARLTDRLGPDVQRRYSELRALERRWHDMVSRLLRHPEQARTTRSAITPEEDLYEDLLVAAARLDEALTGAVRARRTRINAAEQMQRRMTLAIGLLALAAAGGVAWLGQRIRVFAREAEDRRVELEHANESRARLMRGVSHDLKNPLGAIDGHAALLEDGIKGPLSAEQRVSVARIRRSVRSLLALIGDLLEMSKAEAGQLSVQPRSADLAEVVRDAVEEHRAAAEAAGHRLQINLHDGLVVRTDPVRVRQVLGNLLSNAVKYTPPGGQIVVRAEERMSNGRRAGRWAAIDVADSGPGIPADKLEEIFGEFSRLQPETTPGTGLGLTIARRIAQLLGGDVSAQSEFGHGATFTVWLPVDGRPSGPRES